MTPLERRYDIDWLRVIAIGLLLIYHIAIGFQPWGTMIGFITTDQTLEGLWTPMTMLNVWRIPFLFFVSGMGVAFAIRKRSWKQLLLERSRRIFVPFLFGFLTIVPIHAFIWQKYFQMNPHYYPNAGHLWFLGNIFVYVIVLTPAFFYLKNRENNLVNRLLDKLFRSPFSLLIIAAFFALEVVIMKPQIFELYAMTWHGFFLGLVAFLFGFLCVHSGTGFWQMLLKWRWFLLAITVILYGIRLTIFQLKAPGHLMGVESSFWIFTVLTFGHKYLNRPSKTLSYLSQRAYPIYIIHMIFLSLGSMLIFKLEIAGVFQLLLLIVFTFSGCFAMYDLIIRRVKILRLLFGLK